VHHESSTTHSKHSFYGYNLNILHTYIANESVDLVYLDPPFNSNSNYNVLFKDESGVDNEAQITAMEPKIPMYPDTYHYGVIKRCQDRDAATVWHIQRVAKSTEEPGRATRVRDVLINKRG